MENEDGILVRLPPPCRTIPSPRPPGHCPGGRWTNNIPIDRCSENGIVVFNTPAQTPTR